MPAQPTHHVHPGDLPYAMPVLRSASPSGSLNTEYGPDETSPSDAELSPVEFAKRVEAELRIHEKREAEVRADAKVLIMPKFKKESLVDERALFDQVMRSLRWHVQQLEEDEIIESTLLRGSQIPLETQSTRDVDDIMQTLMGPALPSVPSSPMSVDDPFGLPGHISRRDFEGSLFGGGHPGKGKARAG